jgi:hypothetical protein
MCMTPPHNPSQASEYLQMSPGTRAAVISSNDPLIKGSDQARINRVAIVITLGDTLPMI